MNRFEHVGRAFRFECVLAVAACRSRSCLASRITLLVGLGYVLGPWDWRPDHLLIVSYLEAAAVVLNVLAIARLLVPPAFEHHVANAGGFAGGAEHHGHPAYPGIRLAKLRSALLAQRLVLGRRLRRYKAHVGCFARRTGSRWIAARSTHDIGAFCFALFGYRLWWRLRAPFARVGCDDRSLVVIGGAARSGTTLLRSILGRHPLIATGPETTVFLRRISSPADLGERLGWDPARIERWQRESRSQVEFVERFRRAVLAQSGKSVWAEKTPKNAEQFRFIRRRFPRARLVHIVRDGRDVVCSLRRTPFAKLDHAQWDSPKAARRCAVQWRTSVKAGLRLRGDARYHELRYEDLVRDAEPVLRGLMAFLDMPWDDRLLEPLTAGLREPEEITAAGDIFMSSVSRWRRDLSPADQRALHMLIGPLLLELGYANGIDWPDDPQAEQSQADRTRAGIYTSRV